jgi:DNA-binding NtrC family response regulator
MTTRVLLVHHDIDLADQEADALRRRGYEVQQCMGPIGARCPVLAGYRCEMADAADVLVYDAWVTGEPEGAERLIEGLREIHPDVPVVLTASGIEPDWIDLAGEHRITPLVGPPTGARLAEAIEQAVSLVGTDGDEAAGGPTPS